MQSRSAARLLHVIAWESHLAETHRDVEFQRALFINSGYRALKKTMNGESQKSKKVQSRRTKDPVRRTLSNRHVHEASYIAEE